MRYCYISQIAVFTMFWYGLALLCRQTAFWYRYTFWQDQARCCYICNSMRYCHISQIAVFTMFAKSRAVDFWSGRETRLPPSFQENSWASSQHRNALIGSGVKSSCAKNLKKMCVSVMHHLDHWYTARSLYNVCRSDLRKLKLQFKEVIKADWDTIPGGVAKGWKQFAN